MRDLKPVLSMFISPKQSLEMYLEATRISSPLYSDHLPVDARYYFKYSVGTEHNYPDMYGQFSAQYVEIINSITQDCVSINVTLVLLKVMYHTMT